MASETAPGSLREGRARNDAATSEGLSALRELWVFARTHIAWWLTPLILAIVLLSLLVVYTQTPQTYAIF